MAWFTCPAWAWARVGGGCCPAAASLLAKCIGIRFQRPPWPGWAGPGAWVRGFRGGIVVVVGGRRWSGGGVAALL